jgi:hypothetical protein
MTGPFHARPAATREREKHLSHPPEMRNISATGLPLVVVRWDEGLRAPADSGGAIHRTTTRIELVYVKKERAREWALSL